MTASPIDDRVAKVTAAIDARSTESRRRYLTKIQAMKDQGPSRPGLSCGNLAHAIAACPEDEKRKLIEQGVANIGIVSAYNDMLSAHQPYHAMLDVMKRHITGAGGVAQMAGGVPAMCDGVTQGQPGMELSLFSRDVIAMATGVALSHNVFDGGMLFGICDKIVPGLLIGALSFGHLPFIFAPAGPMPTGISNSEKQKVRQAYAAGEVGRDALLESESRAYHSPGTCTFYGTANTNQMMLEMMGLQIAGSSFVNPNTPLRDALNRLAAERVVTMAKVDKSERVTLGDMVDAKALVNGIIGLLATGGSTNHSIHIIAIARAAGFHVSWDDFDALSEAVPLLARVYPNGLADVNAFHAAGGVAFVMQELLEAGLLHDDIHTVRGFGLWQSLAEPTLETDAAEGGDTPVLSLPRPPAAPRDDSILRKASTPFQPTGGLKVLQGNLGTGVIKISAVKEQHRLVEAPAIVLDSQEDLIALHKKGELERDFVAVIRFQGPRANGMPELHKLTPILGVLQDKGYRVALVTDGRMSGASGKVPAAIHMSPEAKDGGPLAKLKTGDMVRLDPEASRLEVLIDAADLAARPLADPPPEEETIGRDMFGVFRDTVGPAAAGGSVFRY